MRKIFRFLKWILKLIESWLLRFGEELKYRMKAKRLLRNAPQPALTRAEKREIRSFYRKYQVWFPGTNWHRLYAGITREFSPEFVPLNLFYGNIERSLNREEFAVLQDKNLLDRIFPYVERPKIVISNINGFLYHEDKLINNDKALEILGRYDKLFIKPSLDSGGGKNVCMLERETIENIEELNRLLGFYKKDYVIQEALRQSPEMSKLNASSINSLRMVTYLRPSGAVVLSSNIRIGREGSPIDNTESGGASVMVHPDGQLNHIAIDKDFKIIDKEIDGESLSSFRVPNFERVREMALGLHSQIPYFKIVSWDISLNEKNLPVLIEFNVIDQGINQQRLVGPLFGKYADEILQEYRKNLVR